MTKRTQSKIVMFFCFILLMVPCLVVASSPGSLKWKLGIGEKGKSGTSLSAVEDEIFSIDAGSIPYVTPAVDRNGRIYVGSDDNKFYAVNPDGSVEWIKYIGEGMYGSPAIDKYGNLFVVDESGVLRVLDPNGNPKWQYEGGGFLTYSSPILDDRGAVYFLDANSNLYCLLAEDGSFIWKSEDPASAYHASPVMGAGRTFGIVYVPGDDLLYAIDADNGALLWTFEVGAESFSDYICTPALGADGMIYFTSTNDTLYALDTTGTLKWTFQAGEDFESGPVIGFDETIYVGSLDHFLYALNPDGTLKWSFEAENDIPCSPVIASDSTIYLCDKDNMYALTQEGVLKWKYDDFYITYNGSPTITDGLIICPGLSSLKAIDTGTKARLANTAWPKHLHDSRNTANALTASANTITDPGKITLRCGSISAQAGTTVQVPIYMDNPDVDISGGYFIISPQSTELLVFQSITTTSRTDGWEIASSDIGTGLSVVIYSDENALIEAGSGEIAVLTYAVSADAVANSEVQLELSVTEFTNSDLVAVSTELQVGIVSIFDCGLSGDLDSDGKVGIVDILTMVLYMRGVKTPSSEDAVCADLTGDGTIDVNDVLACVDLALGSNSQLAGTADQVDMAKLKQSLVALGADQSLVDEISGMVTAAVPGASLPKAFKMNQNFPNPFNPSTSISYSVPDGYAGNVELKVFDLRGKLIKTLVDGAREPGEYTAFWDATDNFGQQLSSGIFLYRLRAGNFVETRKMVLLK